VVGRLGSTGRSTGPHLHYETRVDGEAVDPDKFLRAGLKLGAIQ
jgi:murein DD-endopeptidase MepM/ murein hydrolase activator NlpD